MTTDHKLYEIGDLREVQKRNLLEAARRADVQEVTDLLEMGVSANVRDEIGMTPLMLSCIADTRDELHSVHRHGRKEATAVAHALLEKAADMNALGPGGWPPIFFSAFYCDFDVMRTLIHARCDVNIRDDSGRSLASWVRYGDQDREHQKAVLKMLYRHGFPAPVEAKVKAGQLQPDFWAPIPVDQKLSELLSLGADLIWKDCRGRTFGKRKLVKARKYESDDEGISSKNVGQIFKNPFEGKI
mmetsp:Transcript_50691/g.94690  ORF Transcript_50691/g.94690 Transcript_50691/m.94690 type:complete len:243 (+) Transcript_50691:132-860(+)